MSGDVKFEPGCVQLGSAIACGPGGVTIRRTGNCSGCKGEHLRIVTTHPNSAYYGPDDLCEHGCWVQDDYACDPDNASARAATFEGRWERALPEGTTANYDNEDAWLVSVTLPDGTVVTR